MSNFAIALNELLEERKMSQAELAARTGIVQPQISRWINDEPSRISGPNFERLCKVFTKPTEQAGLIRARMMDLVAEFNVPGKRLVTVAVNGSPVSEPAEPTPTKLPPKVDRDIQTIIEHLPKDRLVRDMISSMAGHLRRKSP